MAQPIVEPCSRGIIDAAPDACGRELSPPHRRVVLAACVLASSMAFIDGSALTVALPRLRAAIGADLASVQWVLNGYVLALASLTLIGGALADRLRQGPHSGARLSRVRRRIVGLRAGAFGRAG